MIFKRKDAKAHGTKKMVEGVYKENDRCLVVDDVVTSGISILETVEVNIQIDLNYHQIKKYYIYSFVGLKSLREHKIQIKDAMVLLDREQGGSENVGNSNVTLHSIINTSQILDVLIKGKKIDQNIFDKTQEFLNANKYVPVAKTAPKVRIQTIQVFDLITQINT